MSAHHAKVVLVEKPAQFQWSVAEGTELCRYDYEKIGIDEIRSLITEAHRLPSEGNFQKEIVLSGLSITREAEQASLKILEEPPAHISIVFLLPIGTHLLDTVLSRVEKKVQLSEPSSSETTLLAWLKLATADRLAEVEARLKNKDTEWIHAIRSDLLQMSSSTEIISAESYEDAHLVINNLLTRGASNKMLLEHLALSLPVTK